jgi:hypothetical protein
MRHTPLSDEALRATFTEYTIPSRRTMPHSVIVDDKSGTVWFSEYDAASNKMARFNPETERFDQFPIPVPQSNAHTGAVLADGSYLVGLDRPGADGKVAGIDRDGHVVVYEFPGKPQGSRMVVADPTREDTAWLAAGDEVWRLNTKSKQFLVFKNPVVQKFPEGSYGGMVALPGRRPAADTANGLHARLGATMNQGRGRLQGRPQVKEEADGLSNFTCRRSRRILGSQSWRRETLAQ